MKRAGGVEPTPIETYRRFHSRREAERFRRSEDLRRSWLEQVRSAVRRLAPTFPGVTAVHAFGSLVEPGRFTAGSDLDLAVRCNDLDEESRFWRALEEAVQRDVDLRPLAGAIAQVAALRGEPIYEREAPAPGTEH